jgi:hypothetical protein
MLGNEGSRTSAAAQWMVEHWDKGRMLWWTRNALAILSFVIYACSALLLNQSETSKWNPEHTDSIPAAISFGVYGAPLGTIVRDVWGTMRTRETLGLSMQQVFERVVRGPIQPAPLIRITTDGNGIGYFTFAGVAFKLLGPRLASLTEFFLILVGLSALGFVLRFQDDRLFAVPLCFFTLTLMLFTPLASSAVHELTIGGIRYFSLAGILPALYVCYEIADRSELSYSRREGNVLLLALQTLLLVLVILVRTNAIYLAVPIAIVSLRKIAAIRAVRSTLQEQLHKIGFTTALCVVFGAFFVASVVPDYLKTGAFNAGIWHRAFISFGYNPAWPFPIVRKTYDCTSDAHPNGLRPGIQDSNGHCVWIVYRTERGLPDNAMELNAGAYQTALRKAYMTVLINHPWEALKTYVYYKPSSIVATVWASMTFELSGRRATILPLLIVQFVILGGFVALGAYAGYTREALLAIKVIVLFAPFTIPTYMLAWSHFHTTADLIFYVWAGLTAICIFLARKLLFRLGKKRFDPSLRNTVASSASQ